MAPRSCSPNARSCDSSRRTAPTRALLDGQLATARGRTVRVRDLQTNRSTSTTVRLSAAVQAVALTQRYVYVTLRPTASADPTAFSERRSSSGLLRGAAVMNLNRDRVGGAP